MVKLPKEYWKKHNMGIIDLIIRIKNGYMSKKSMIVGAYSKRGLDVLNLLKKEGYIEDYKIEENGVKKKILIDLLYINGVSAVREIKIVSKPGMRIYMPSRHLKPIQAGSGRIVVTSSKGIITDKEARKNGIGGEVLFQIW